MAESIANYVTARRIHDRICLNTFLADNRGMANIGLTTTRLGGAGPVSDHRQIGHVKSKLYRAHVVKHVRQKW